MRTLHNASLVSGLSIGAGALGFLSQITLAKTFGTTAQMDAYFGALSAPTILMGIAPVVFTAVILPTLASLKGNEAARTRLVQTLLGSMVLFSALVAGAGWLLSPIIVSAFFPLLPDALRATTVQASRLLWCAAGVSLLVSYVGAMRNVDRRFGRVAFIVLLPPLAIITSVLTLSSYLGTLSIALGLLAAGLLQLGIVFPHTFPPFSFRDALPTRHPDLGPLLRRIVPVSLSLLPFTILGFITVYWAAGLPIGCVSYLSYGQAFSGFLSVAVGYGISVVSFPDMAEEFAAGGLDKILAVFEYRFRYVFLLAAIGAVLLVVLRLPILAVAYRHGNFSSSSVRSVADVVPWYLIGAVSIACLNLLRTFSYSIDNVAPLATLGVGIPITYFALAGWLSHRFSYEGIAIAYAGVCVLWLLSAMTWLTQRKYGLWSRELSGFMVKVSLASVASVLMSASTRSIPSLTISEPAAMIVSTGVAIAVFAGAGHFILRIDEVRKMGAVMVTLARKAL